MVDGVACAIEKGSDPDALFVEWGIAEQSDTPESEHVRLTGQDTHPATLFEASSESRSGRGVQIISKYYQVALEV